MDNTVTLRDIEARFHGEGRIFTEVRRMKNTGNLRVNVYLEGEDNKRTFVAKQVRDGFFKYVNTYA